MVKTRSSEFSVSNLLAEEMIDLYNPGLEILRTVSLFRQWKPAMGTIQTSSLWPRLEF